MESRSVKFVLLLLTMESFAINCGCDNTSRNENWSFDALYDVTIDCGNLTVRSQTVSQCQGDLLHMIHNGYPWTIGGIHKYTQSDKNQTNVTNTLSLRDSLDSLDHACHIHDKSRTCLEESNIRDFCLATTGGIHFQRIFTLSAIIRGAMRT